MATRGAEARTSNGLIKPSKSDLLNAAGKKVRDIVGPSLDVLFCGINPSVYSAATGHHFARPGNRFWRVLHEAGFTDALLSPAEDRRLLEYGIGITNLVDRATVAATELTADELKEGARRLERKIRRLHPRTLAVLGIGAFATGFGARPSLGRQDARIEGAVVFVLPNPSGLQARYQLPELVAYFSEVRKAAVTLRGSSPSPGL